MHPPCMGGLSLGQGWKQAFKHLAYEIMATFLQDEGLKKKKILKTTIIIIQQQHLWDILCNLLIFKETLLLSFEIACSPISSNLRRE